MRKYFAELHRKPDHHKKRFALLASSTLTLFIFSIWALAVFGVAESEKVVSKDSQTVISQETEGEIGPLESLRLNLASSFNALRNSLGELKAGVETINIEAEYTNIREGALEIYGQ